MKTLDMLQEKDATTREQERIIFIIDSLMNITFIFKIHIKLFVNYAS
jgi:hypothetical protein